MDIVNYRGGGPIEIGLARQATHYIWTDPRSRCSTHMPLIGHIQAKFYEMTDDGVEYSIPYDRDRPGPDRGRLRRLPVQRVRGQPAHPGRLPGRQRRAGPPPARHVRPPARRDQPERTPDVFDQYIVCEESFRARDDGRTGGVVEVRMPYYRGLTLSMVEAVDLVLDGSRCPPSRTTFTVHGNTYTFDRAAADHRRPLGDGGAGRARLRDRRAAGRRASTTSPSPSGCGSRTCRCPAAAGTPSG